MLTFLGVALTLLIIGTLVLEVINFVRTKSHNFAYSGYGGTSGEALSGTNYEAPNVVDRQRLCYRRYSPRK